MKNYSLSMRMAQFRNAGLHGSQDNMVILIAAFFYISPSTEFGCTDSSYFWCF